MYLDLGIGKAEPPAFTGIHTNAQIMAYGRSILSSHKQGMLSWQY